MTKRKRIYQADQFNHKRCIRLLQRDKHQATVPAPEAHQQMQDWKERDARCHHESKCGTETTDDQTTEALDHSVRSAGSECHASNEPKWRQWHTDACKQKVRDNLNRFHQSMSSLQFGMCELRHEMWPMMKVRVRNNLHMCDHCHRGKSIPKLFSSQNNAIPGPVGVIGNMLPLVCPRTEFPREFCSLGHNILRNTVFQEQDILGNLHGPSAPHRKHCTSPIKRLSPIQAAALKVLPNHIQLL